MCRNTQNMENYLLTVYLYVCIYTYTLPLRLSFMWHKFWVLQPQAIKKIIIVVLETLSYVKFKIAI